MDQLEMLKSLLIGKEFNEENYGESLTNILSKYNLEPNICDFDIDRIYTLGYEKLENWDDVYVASIELSYDCKDEKECDVILKIVDVY